MKRFKNILCVVEPGETSEHLLERAVNLAENNQAKLAVTMVTDQIPTNATIFDEVASATDIQSALITTSEKDIESKVEPYRKRVDIKTRVLTGTPFLVIIRAVLQGKHDLLIKLSDTDDWLDRFFSSDDMHLFRKCPCPIWIIKPNAKKTFKRILVSVDVNESGSPEEQSSQHALNQQTLEMGCSLALSDFAELHIVHVWHAIGESAMRGAFLDTSEEKIAVYTEQIRQKRLTSVDNLLKDVAGKLGKDSLDFIKPKTHLIKGWARKEIPELAKKIDADLVVMGTVARTGIHGFFMGNTAETILNQIDCSVLAIKPPGFETPITIEE